MDILCDFISEESDMPNLQERFNLLKPTIDAINNDEDPILRPVLDFFDALFFSDRMAECNAVAVFAEMPPLRMGWSQHYPTGYLISINYLHGATTSRDGEPMSRADAVLGTLLHECIHVYNMGMPCDDPDQPCDLPSLGMHAAFAPTGHGPYFDKVAKALEAAAARLGLPLTLNVIDY